MYGEKIYFVVYIDGHEMQVALFDNEDAKTKTVESLRAAGKHIVRHEFGYLNADAL